MSEVGSVVASLSAGRAARYHVECTEYRRRLIAKDNPRFRSSSHLPVTIPFPRQWDKGTTLDYTMDMPLSPSSRGSTVPAAVLASPPDGMLCDQYEASDDCPCLGSWPLPHYCPHCCKPRPSFPWLVNPASLPPSQRTDTARDSRAHALDRDLALTTIRRDKTRPI